MSKLDDRIYPFINYSSRQMFEQNGEYSFDSVRKWGRVFPN